MLSLSRVNISYMCLNMSPPKDFSQGGQSRGQRDWVHGLTGPVFVHHT